jgi:hypothetical protein
MNPTQDIVERVASSSTDIQDFIEIYNAMWLEIKSA